MGYLSGTLSRMSPKEREMYYELRKELRKYDIEELRTLIQEHESKSRLTLIVQNVFPNGNRLKNLRYKIAKEISEDRVRQRIRS